MCGIAGIFWGAERAALDEAEALVRCMNETMVHRGPDADGVWVAANGHCALAHRRLSIIDTSSAGTQPMASQDGRWRVTFNGEIYNFLELRPRLEAEGYHFRGRTDTEVLLAVLSLWGTKGIESLDGMFAFAAFDTHTGQLILARDPFGEKPLYYTRFGSGGIAFASELQALETLPFFDNVLSVDAVGELLSFQYIGAPRTIYEHVSKLPPGSFMQIDPTGASEIKVHYTFEPNGVEHHGRNIEDLTDELEDHLVRSLERRIISDVPLGAFLSGGVDSSVVCALIRKRLGRDLQTFSIGFEGSPESEHEIARQFAKHLGCEHYDEILRPQANEFLRHFGEYVDEPHGDSSCLPTYLLSKFARKSVTVCLSGDGGDELFGGYGRYLASLADLENPRRSSSLGDLYYSNRILVYTEPHLREILGFVPEQFAQHLAQLRRDIDHSGIPPINRLRQTDQVNYMPGAVLSKVDRMSMQHSLEVRTPFLSRDLARFAEGIPSDLIANSKKGKLLLRNLAYRYLPRDLIDLPKKGFGMPLSDWARQQKLALADEMLRGDSSHVREFFGSAGLDRFLARQVSKHGFSPYQVWTVLALESWMREHSYRLPKSNLSRENLSVPAKGRRRIEQNTIIMVDHMPLDVPEVVAKHSYFVVSKSSDSRTHDLQLENWYSSTDWIKKGTLGDLRGKTIIVTVAEFLNQLYWLPLNLLHQKGLKRLAVLDPTVVENSSFDYWQVIDFTPHAYTSRQVSGFCFRWSAEKSQRLKVEFKDRGRCFHEFELAKDIVGSTDHDSVEDQVFDFFVYEDGRALPQVNVSHDLIRSGGRGLYSIWNGKLIVAPTRKKGRLMHPRHYEVFPVTPELKRRFPYSGFRQHIKDLSVSITLEEWLSKKTKESVVAGKATLAPGGKVGILTASLQAGGAERQWCFLARALKQQGFDVYFYTLESLCGSLAHYRYLLEDADVRIIEIKPLVRGGNLETALLKSFVLGPDRDKLDHEILSADEWPIIEALAAQLEADRVEALFCQLDSPNIIGGAAGLLAGVPRTVLSFRNYNPSNFPYFNMRHYRECYHFLAQSGQVLLAGNSQDCNDDYAEWADFGSRKVAHIPNAVDVSILDAKTSRVGGGIREELKIAEDAPVISGVFRLSEEKRPLEFLKIADELLNRNQTLHVILAGDGPMMEAVRSMREKFSCAERLHLVGRRSDIFEIMLASDLLLLTSEREGMPNVILEAMSAGLPVVATRTGGVPDLVKDGSTGFVCEVGDLEAILNRCQEILDDPQKAKEMSEQARAAVANKYDVESLGEAYIKLVNES